MSGKKSPQREVLITLGGNKSPQRGTYNIGVLISPHTGIYHFGEEKIMKKESGKSKHRHLEFPGGIRPE